MHVEATVKTVRSIDDSNIEFYQNSESDLNIPTNWNKPFDLIVSNILAAPLIAMRDPIRALCHKNTRVILSGFLDYQQKEIEDHYNSIGFTTEKVFSDKKWISLLLKVNND